MVPIVNGKIVGEHRTIKCKKGHTILTTTKEEKSEDELCKEVAVKSEKAKIRARKHEARARKHEARAKKQEAKAIEQVFR